MSPEQTTARRRLACQQAALVRSLKCGGAPPEGFDLSKLATAERSLASKRSRSVMKTWPLLTAALSDKFADHFNNYARQFPTAPAPGPAEDGRRFARWLKSRRLLPDAGRVELAAFEARGGFPLRITWLNQPSALAIAWRFSKHGTKILRIRLPQI